MSAGVILPVAKALYLCDGHLGFTSRKTDLMGIFDSIRPHGGYPHIHAPFVVFARLAQGLGTIPTTLWHGLLTMPRRLTEGLPEPV